MCSRPFLGFLSAFEANERLARRGTTDVHACAYYWTDNVIDGFPNDTWAVSFDASFSGTSGQGGLNFAGTSPTFAWCVRGGASVDIQ